MKINLVLPRETQFTTRLSSPSLTVSLFFILNVSLNTSTAAPNYPHSLHCLGQKIGHPNLFDLVRKYLVKQAQGTIPPLPCINVSHVEHLKIFHSAHTVFCVPSNPSTTVGMFHEMIHATPTWNQGEVPGPHYDCVFISNRSVSDAPILSNLLVACVLLLFSFLLDGKLHQCCLIHWFSIFGDKPDPDNRMWIAMPEYSGGAPNLSVIHIDSIFRAMHLLPIFDDAPLL